MGVVYLAYCGSWQLSLHVPCFCAFYIFNTTPNPTSSSFFQNVFVLVIIGTFYIQNFSLVQEEDGSIVVQCVYAISTDDTVQCVVVFTDVQSGYTWNTTVGHTPGTHPPVGSKVITVPRAGVYSITVYDSVGDITVLAIVYDGTVYINDSITTTG